ncbi:hypothetical protein AGMMS50229_01340 [Campylobacterota bacterium]|nr:hypothetical protein AGMMS50229_01340 [Campylobacterota bacterium]
MEIIPEIKAYFEAKDGIIDSIDNYFTDDIRIEDTGENNIITGFGECKIWLQKKSQQYKMETRIVDIITDTDGIIKVSVLVSGNFSPNSFPFDYYFTIKNGKIKNVKIVYTGE